MKRKHQILTIPNLMSLFRLCLIPLIVWLYHKKEMYGLAAFTLVVSGITDVADGIVARRFNMVSNFGKAFDPVADKLTQFAMLVCLAVRFHSILVPMCLILVKEILIGVTNFFRDPAFFEKYSRMPRSQYGLEALPAILRFTREVRKYVPQVRMTVVDTLSISAPQTIRIL